MLSIVIEPKIILIVALSLLILFSLVYLFKDQIDELVTKFRKTSLLHSNLKKFCKNHDYILLTNIILPTEDGKKIKIDDLVLADKYIYIISQRILYGNIFGDENDAKWIVRSLKEAKYFSNPFKSNEIRLNIAAQISKVDKSSFINLVCFSKTAFIKDIKINKPNSLLTTVEKIEKDIIKKEKNSPYNDFLPEEVEKVANYFYQTSIKTTRN